MKSASGGVFGGAAPACSGCGLRETCEVEDPGRQGPFSGASLVLVAVGYFGLPLLFAVAGALAAGSDPVAQLVGGGGGLFLGVLTTTRLARLLCPQSETRRST